MQPKDLTLSKIAKMEPNRPVQIYGDLFRNGNIPTRDKLVNLENYITNFNQIVEGYPITIHCLAHYIAYHYNYDIYDECLTELLEFLHNKEAVVSNPKPLIRQYLQQKYRIDNIKLSNYSSLIEKFTF